MQVNSIFQLVSSFLGPYFFTAKSAFSLPVRPEWPGTHRISYKVSVALELSGFLID